jgi:hypothetical protein
LPAAPALQGHVMSAKKTKKKNQSFPPSLAARAVSKKKKLT